jgi:sodium transport system ATP-binding protein
VIVIDRLHKSFGTKTAVDDVTFSALDGQITGLVGPNGAGKTTTLRMLYTLLKPDRGSITVGGVDAATQPLEVRRRLGVLPDARGLYKRLTARENIAYYAQLHGMDAELIRRRTNSLIETLAMQDIADRRVEGFSQGERVKTAIARALVHEPPHIVFDEPSNGLDVIATRTLRDFLRQLKVEGRCVLFSSHIMQEVAALCDRIVIIAAGRVVADGSPDALRELTKEQSLEEAFVKIIGAATVERLA